MKVLLINGPVVDDSDTWFYDYWGDPYVSPKKVRDFLSEANGEDIQVSINSGGGSVFAGSEIYTMLKSYSGHVDVVIAGLAASIASVIMLAGDSIKASPMAQVMIHNATMGEYGDYRDFEHASVVIGGVSQSLIGLYVNKTGRNEEEIRKLVDAESWFGAEKAKEIGLVDDILFTESVSLIASVGNYADKEKIARFKEIMDRENIEVDNPVATILERIDSIEHRLHQIVDSAVSKTTSGEQPLEDNGALNTSPFAKFIL